MVAHSCHTAPRRLKQEAQEFKVSLGYTASQNKQGQNKKVQAHREFEHKAKKTSPGRRNHLTGVGSTSRPSMSLNKILALEDFLKMEGSPGMAPRIMHVFQTEASGATGFAAAGVLDKRVQSPQGLISEASLKSCRCHFCPDVLKQGVVQLDRID